MRSASKPSMRRTDVVGSSGIVSAPWSAIRAVPYRGSQYGKRGRPEPVCREALLPRQQLPRHVMFQHENKLTERIRMIPSLLAGSLHLSKEKGGMANALPESRSNHTGRLLAPGSHSTLWVRHHPTY